MLQLNDSLREAIERKESTDSILKSFAEEYKGVKSEIGPYDQLNHLKILLLNQAIQNNYDTFVEKLLDTGGIDLDSFHGHSYNTPLAIACYLKKPQVVKILLQHGADVQHTGAVLNYESPKPAFDFAMRHDDYQFIEPLLEVYHNSKDEYMRSPTIVACQEGAYKCLKRLLQLNPDSVHGKDTNGKTPLMHAIPRGIKFIKLLLDNGSDLNHVDKNNRTCLHYLFSTENYQYPFCLPSETVETLQFLLNNGAKVNVLDNQGQSAVSSLCYHIKVGVRSMRPNADMPYSLKEANAIVAQCFHILAKHGQDFNLDSNRTPVALVVNQIRSGVGNFIRMLNWSDDATKIDDAMNAFVETLEFTKRLLNVLFTNGATAEFSSDPSMSLLTQIGFTLQFNRRCPQDNGEILNEHLMDITRIFLHNGAKTFQPFCSGNQDSHHFCFGLFNCILNSLQHDDYYAMLNILLNHAATGYCSYDVEELLAGLTSNPRSLKAMSRLTISSRLAGHDNNAVVDALPLPKSLKNFIKSFE
ncbi:unnamed protein product [Owenia fusiformis]|nr:unnamed protein product [Owenia fusiformis]